MPEGSGEEGFTFVDRRGRREEPEGAEPAGPATAPSPPPRPPRARVSREPSPFDAAQEPDLSALFLMLASSALVNLGVTPEPMTGTPRLDLAQAKLSIDLLRLLRDKTEGHRTAEESQLLADVLHDLQVRFVEAAKRR